MIPAWRLKPAVRPHYGNHVLAAAEFIGLSLGSLAGGIVANAHGVPGPALGIRHVENLGGVSLGGELRCRVFGILGVKEGAHLDRMGHAGWDRRFRD